MWFKAFGKYFMETDNVGVCAWYSWSESSKCLLFNLNGNYAANLFTRKRRRMVILNDTVWIKIDFCLHLLLRIFCVPKLKGTGVVKRGRSCIWDKIQIGFVAFCPNRWWLADSFSSASPFNCTPVPFGWAIAGWQHFNLIQYPAN